MSTIARNPHFLFLAFLGCLLALRAQETVCPIYPRPMIFQSTGEEIAFPSDVQGAIVVADDIHETVQYAAERLQLSLQRLAKRNYPIVTEVPAEATLVFMLGVPDADARLKIWCESHGLDVAEQNWGDDGYLIHFAQEASRTTIGVAAGIPRGVIYGQESLTWLFAGKDTLTVAEVRDHALVKWRSFAQDRLSRYTEECLDRYADARINCIELRDGSDKPEPGFPQGARGMFGYPYDVEIKGDEESRVLREAHRRGMFVWGVVRCGVAEEHHDQVMAQFERLIELGVDGLYISYDDPGSFDGAPKLIARVLELARERGFDHDHVAYLPPLPDYGDIYEEFNLQLVTMVPEITQVRWFLTRPLSLMRTQFLADLGVTRKTGFWFNWPMGGKPAWRDIGVDNTYRALPDFTDGYGTDDAMVAGCEDDIDAVMVWVRGDEEYLAQLLCAAFWNPQVFTRRAAWARVYGRAYGAKMVKTAASMDERMTWLKAQMKINGPWDWMQSVWMLASTDSKRFIPRKLMADMRRLYDELVAEAPKGSWMSQEQLEQRLLVPMKNTLDRLGLLVETDFPEYIYPNFDRDMKWELEVKHTPRETFVGYWGPIIEKLLKVVEERFGDSPYTKEYVDGWRKKLAPAAEPAQAE